MISSDWTWVVWTLLVLTFLIGAIFWLSGNRGGASRTGADRTSRLPTPGRRRLFPHWGPAPEGHLRSDERIAEEINDKLILSQELDASAVEVHLKSGAVTLSGSVTDRDEKRIAAAIVGTVAGVTHVTNKLTIRKRVA